MKIKRQKALHGWAFQITDDENKEIFIGNIEATIKEAKASVIRDFIEERQRLIKDTQGDAFILIGQIEQAKRL